MKVLRIALVVGISLLSLACGSNDKPNNDLGTADMAAPQGAARVKFSMKGVK
jgi:hypothetical protein